jgi:predicted RNA binding protein YcfA (HicA-like mRNA interferase family)
MPPRLPQTDGDSVVALRRRLGYDVVRTKGGHIQLKKTTAAGEHRVTVPAHKVLAKGTLSDILNRVSERNGFSKVELLDQLR